jgi:hypothetical protein
VIPTWLVWSVAPPENLEKVSCASPLDAARAWAERQFRNGLVPHSGIEVRVRCVNDPVLLRRAPPPGSTPRPHVMSTEAMTMTTYQVKITLVNAPAFRASLIGVAYEKTSEDPGRGNHRG